MKRTKKYTSKEVVALLTLGKCPQLVLCSYFVVDLRLSDNRVLGTYHDYFVTPIRVGTTLCCNQTYYRTVQLLHY